MIVARLLSTRSPYRRGGLVFDASSRRVADGRAMVALTREQAGRMSPEDFTDLRGDPAITIELPVDLGGFVGVFVDMKTLARLVAEAQREQPDEEESTVDVETPPAKAGPKAKKPRAGA
jgi:hypothetical protein